MKRLVTLFVVACQHSAAPPPLTESPPIDPPGRAPVQPVVLPVVNVAHATRALGPTLVAAPDCGATVELHGLDNAPTCAILVKTDRSVTVVDTLSMCRADRVQAIRATCSGVDLTVELTTKPNGSFWIRCAANQCSRSSDQAFESAGGADRAHSGLSDFLGVVEDAVAAHDWKTLLSYASPGHNTDDPTYLAELLGVHTVGNSITAGRVTFADLDSIRSIEVAEISDDGITGLVHLTSGATLHLYMDVVKHGDHFELTGAAG